MGADRPAATAWGCRRPLRHRSVAVSSLLSPLLLSWPLAAATIRREAQGQALDIQTDYVHDNTGIRVFAGESAVRVADGQVVFDRSRTFLLDGRNHTGYAQVLEEYHGAANLARSYVIGNDVISQACRTIRPTPNT